MSNPYDPPPHDPPSTTAFEPTAPPPPPSEPPLRGAPAWASPGVRLVLAIVIGTVALGIYIAGRGGKSAAAGEIFLEGSDQPGTDTFTPSIAAAPPATTAPNATETPKASSAGIIKTDASKPGLYAGQRDVPSCDANGLVSYLEANADRAAPWAAALGIARADIRAYVATLTPALLRVDTRLTDYGFADGRAVPRQVILQAGSAVLLDRTAVPRVRCESGDPLAEPQPVVSAPQYTGPRWAGFSPTTIVVVAPAPATTTLVLIDIVTGDPFVRIPGSIVIIDVDRPPDGVTLIVVEPGGPARITGENWPAGTAVTITFDDPAVVLGTTAADGGGNIAVNVTIPTTATPGPHTVTISGGGFSVPQTIYVLPPMPRARVTPGA